MAGSDNPERGSPPDARPSSASHPPEFPAEGPESPDLVEPRRSRWPLKAISGLRRLGNAGSAAAVVIGAVTALFGAYAAYQALPEAVSVQDWARHTNAVCEMSAADRRDPLRQVSDVIQIVSVQIAAPTPNFGQVAADLKTTARGLEDNADAYRSLIGQVRELQPPDDDARTRALLAAGSDVYVGLDSVALDLTHVSEGLATLSTGALADPQSLRVLLASLSTTTRDLDTMQRATWPVYVRRVIDLDLDRCPGWNATGKPLPVPG